MGALTLKFITFYSSLMLFSTSNYLQDLDLDERINRAFTPIANWWEALILHPFPGTEFLFGQSIPTIIILLVGGALFFTIYFGFVNVRRFSTSVKIVMGKYDSLEKNQSSDVKKNLDQNSKDGEVSHFQALATAVSGTWI